MFEVVGTWWSMGAPLAFHVLFLFSFFFSLGDETLRRKEGREYEVGDDGKKGIDGD